MTNISGSGYNRTNERRAEMNRLTQWIDEDRAIPRVDLRRCGHERCATQLARYEDTGLTPEQIRELVERDKSCKVKINAGVPICPVCGRRVVRCYDFCPDCGQRLEQ